MIIQHIFLICFATVDLCDTPQYGSYVSNSLPEGQKWFPVNL